LGLGGARLGLARQGLAWLGAARRGFLLKGKIYGIIVIWADAQRLEDLNDYRSLGECIAIEQPDVCEEVEIRIAFWDAFEKLSDDDKKVIELLACGNKLKDIKQEVTDTKRRISRAKRKFKWYLERCGVELD